MLGETGWRGILSLPLAERDGGLTGSGRPSSCVTTDVVCNTNNGNDKNKNSLAFLCGPRSWHRTCSTRSERKAAARFAPALRRIRVPSSSPVSHPPSRASSIASSESQPPHPRCCLLLHTRGVVDGRTNLRSGEDMKPLTSGIMTSFSGLNTARHATNFPSPSFVAPTAHIVAPREGMDF